MLKSEKPLVHSLLHLLLLLLLLHSSSLWRRRRRKMSEQSKATEENTEGKKWLLKREAEVVTRYAGVQHKHGLSPGHTEGFLVRSLHFFSMSAEVFARYCTVLWFLPTVQKQASLGQMETLKTTLKRLLTAPIWEYENELCVFLVMDRWPV